MYCHFSVLGCIPHSHYCWSCQCFLLFPICILLTLWLHCFTVYFLFIISVIPCTFLKAVTASCVIITLTVSRCLHLLHLLHHLSCFITFLWETNPSVAGSHYMRVRDRGRFNWPTDYTLYTLWAPHPFSISLQEALLFTGPWVQRDRSPRTRLLFVCVTWLGNRDEFVHCLGGRWEDWTRPQEKL